MGLMKNKSINWGEIAGGAAFFGFIGAAVTGLFMGLVALVNAENRSDLQNEFNNNALYENIDGIDYWLASPSTVRYNDGGINYIFNFDSGMVTLDGPDDNTDFTKTFEDFNRPALVERVRDAGCANAANVPSLFQEFMNNELVGDRTYEDSEEYVERAAVFARNHCAGWTPETPSQG